MASECILCVCVCVFPVKVSQHAALSVLLISNTSVTPTLATWAVSQYVCDNLISCVCVCVCAMKTQTDLSGCSSSFVLISLPWSQENGSRGGAAASAVNVVLCAKESINPQPFCPKRGFEPLRLRPCPFVRAPLHSRWRQSEWMWVDVHLLVLLHNSQFVELCLLWHEGYFPSCHYEFKLKPIIKTSKAPGQFPKCNRKCFFYSKLSPYA